MRNASRAADRSRAPRHCASHHPRQRSAGLIPIIFTFAPSAAVQVAGKSILVQLDHRCRVVVIDEQFVPERPNPLVEPRPVESTEKPGRAAGRPGKAPFALAASRGRRFVRKADPALLREIRRLEIDLVVRHGLLSQVDYDAVGGGTAVVLDTECTIEETVMTDTVYTVIVVDESGNPVDMYSEIELDTSVEYKTMTDDSEHTTINGLLDRLGMPGL